VTLALQYNNSAAFAVMLAGSTYNAPAGSSTVAAGMASRQLLAVLSGVCSVQGVFAVMQARTVPLSGSVMQHSAQRSSSVTWWLLLPAYAATPIMHVYVYAHVCPAGPGPSAAKTGSAAGDATPMKTPLRSSSNAGAQQAPARTLEVRQRFAAHMHVLAVAAVAASAFRAPQALRPACPRLPEAHVLQQQLYATLPPALLL
jgi:hypothetical protein